MSFRIYKLLYHTLKIESANLSAFSYKLSYSSSTISLFASLLHIRYFLPS